MWLPFDVIVLLVTMVVEYCSSLTYECLVFREWAVKLLEENWVEFLANYCACQFLHCMI